jgi:hypothetical protein
MRAKKIVAATCATLAFAARGGGLAGAMMRLTSYTLVLPLQW